MWQILSVIFVIFAARVLYNGFISYCHARRVPTHEIVGKVLKRLSIATGVLATLILFAGLFWVYGSTPTGEYVANQIEIWFSIVVIYAVLIGFAVLMVELYHYLRRGRTRKLGG